MCKCVFDASCTLIVDHIPCGYTIVMVLRNAALLFQVFFSPIPVEVVYRAMVYIVVVGTNAHTIVPNTYTHT